MTSILKIFQRPSIKTLFLFVVTFIFSKPVGAFDFSKWNSILKNNVSSKTVSGVRFNAIDYKKIQFDPVLNVLLSNLENFSTSKLNSKNNQLAFWINVYNIMAVKIVVDHYPLKSIRDIGNLFNPVWSQYTGLVDGKKRTLNEIEHKILRKMNEPRIHAAIVCASVSCPDLRKEAFSPKNLDTQLDEQMKFFLSNKNKGLRIENNKLYLSPIFKWFKEDFESSGGVLKFIATYLDKSDKTLFIPDKPKIIYMNYNWELNVR